MHNKNYETNPGKGPSKREDVVSGVHLSASKRKKSRLECTTKRTQGRVYGNGETALVLRRCLLNMVDRRWWTGSGGPADSFIFGPPFATTSS